MRRQALAVAALVVAAPVLGAAGGGAWSQWTAGHEISDRASLQRGAAAYMNYCAGCHSLKYMRYQRLGEDLGIPEALLREHLIPDDQRPTDYILTSMPAADSENWFGKAPPDLSLIARAKGPDYVFQFLKTFHSEPAKPTGVDNLALPGTAMPHVLADLQGVQRAVFIEEPAVDADGNPTTVRVFEKFELDTPGQLTPEQYDAFARDLVNFLDYVGEPAKLVRTTLGIWVVLFLLAFTGIAWLLKSEYWKDVR
jgi:ubiquinol-cytochrome c reductase cytochrome c1 subunit